MLLTPKHTTGRVYLDVVHRSRRKFVSHYHRVEWEGLRINVSPDAWWRPWGLRMRPFQRGSQVPVRIEIGGSNPKGVKAIQLVVERSGGGVSSHSLKETFFQVETQPILHFRTQNLVYSGEYTLTLRFLDNDPKIKGSMMEIGQKLVGVVEVHTNISMLLVTLPPVSSFLTWLGQVIYHRYTG